MKWAKILVLLTVLFGFMLFLSCENDEGTSPKKQQKETEEESWLNSGDSFVAQYSWIVSVKSC